MLFFTSFVLLKITAYQEILFLVSLEKILQQILYINNIFGIIDYFNGRYSCFHCT